MTRPIMAEAMGYIEDDLLAESDVTAKNRRKRKYLFIAAACACIAILCLGISSSKSEFSEYLAELPSGEQNISSTVLCCDFVEVDGLTVSYEKILEDSRLSNYLEKKYAETQGKIWYLPAGRDDYGYLIQFLDGKYSLWNYFYVNAAADEKLTYGDVLKTIYHVKSPTDIKLIKTSPLYDSTDLGKEIQAKIGVKEYSGENEIESIYEVLADAEYYGQDSDYLTDLDRYKYSFSTNADRFHKLESGEIEYGTRNIELIFKSGSSFRSLKYEALSGCFYEYGGIYSVPMDDENVHLLNDIFCIE